MVDCAALRPVLELLPVPALALKCKFSIGSSKLTMQANLEVSKHQCRRNAAQPPWIKCLYQDNNDSEIINVCWDTVLSFHQLVYLFFKNVVTFFIHSSCLFVQMGEPGSILKHSSWSLKLGLQLSDSVSFSFPANPGSNWSLFCFEEGLCIGLYLAGNYNFKAKSLVGSHGHKMFLSSVFCSW